MRFTEHLLSSVSRPLLHFTFNMARAVSPLAELLGTRELPPHLATENAKIARALAYAEKLYAGREHWTGVPLLTHTFDVLRELLPFQPDSDSVCACLLQHALETRSVTLAELEEEFGQGVKMIVSAVHLLSHVTLRTRRNSIEDLRLMLLSVSDDVRVLLIILCDRCCVLERLQGTTGPETRRVCRDVLNLFAPVAARLGIHTLKQRLEALAFPLTYPQDCERITEQLEALRAKHGTFLPAAAKALATALRQQGIAALVQGREKLGFSIFSKMRSRSMTDIQSLPDLFALRVLVQTEEDCYRTLGFLHRMGRPVANRFKDYIAFPKPNGYRSLHTTIARLPGVPEGVTVEVQVRTHAMHREAEYGIAAHWSYKQGGSAERMMQRVALQQMLTSQQPVAGVGGAARLVDHIFVLTPKGDIVELPEGATTLDFAFQIHTQVGLSYRSARVNGSVVPLNYELENGDVVEIVSQGTARPSPEWLQMLKMASSRSRLRRYLHSIDRDKYVDRGKQMINEELKKRRLPGLDADLSLLRRYQGSYLTYSEREDMLMKIGQGSDRVSAHFRHFDLLRELPDLAPSRKSRQVHMPGSAVPVEVEGGVPMPVRFAKCCLSGWVAAIQAGKPPEGEREKIIGTVSRIGEVVVHRSKCRLVKNVNPGRKVGVRWRKA